MDQLLLILVVVTWCRLRCCTYVWAVWLLAWCGPTKPVERNTHTHTLERLEGTYFWSDSEVIFSSINSPLSSDGSGTPGQSSPPRWGSCGSTPGPTTPCPRLFAVNGEKKKQWQMPSRVFWRRTVSVSVAATRPDRHSHFIKNKGLNLGRPGR